MEVLDNIRNKLEQNISIYVTGARFVEGEGLLLELEPEQLDQSLINQSCIEKLINMAISHKFGSKTHMEAEGGCLPTCLTSFYLWAVEMTVLN